MKLERKASRLCRARAPPFQRGQMVVQGSVVHTPTKHRDGVVAQAQIPGRR